MLEIELKTQLLIIFSFLKSLRMNVQSSTEFRKKKKKKGTSFFPIEHLYMKNLQNDIKMI